MIVTYTCYHDYISDAINSRAVSTSMEVHQKGIVMYAANLAVTIKLSGDPAPPYNNCY